MSDLIDRLTVVNAIENTDCELPSDAWDELTDAIMSVPSAQPERKTGRWMFIERREPQFDLYGVKTWAVAYRCSECGLIHAVIEDFGHYAFCPRCGVRMEQPEKNKEKLLPRKKKSKKNLWKCSECVAEMEDDNGN